LISYAKDEGIASLETIIEVPIGLLERLLSMAPMEDWLKIYRIYKENEDLIRSLALANQENVWLAYSALGGSSNNLETKMEQFVIAAEAISSLADIASVMLEKRRDTELKIKNKDSDSKVDERKVKGNAPKQEKTKVSNSKPKDKKGKVDSKKSKSKDEF
jgi:hypothetical protein